MKIICNHGAETCPSRGLRSGVISPNPKSPLPHIILRFFFCPSPNSSFHFRRALKLPNDSDEDGVISFKAFSKWRRDRIRGLGTSSDKGSVLGDPSFKPDASCFSVLVCDSELEASLTSLSSSASLVLTFGAAQGRLTPSLTASKAAETHRSN